MTKRHFQPQRQRLLSCSEQEEQSSRLHSGLILLDNANFRGKLGIPKVKTCDRHQYSQCQGQEWGRHCKKADAYEGWACCEKGERKVKMMT
jgi:hypothetical protein